MVHEGGAVNTTALAATGGNVAFYHAAGETPGAIDDLLPALLEKAVSAGFKVQVVAATPDRVRRLDERLWTYDAAAFLPHAPLADAHAPRAPIVLRHVSDGAAEEGIHLVLAGAEEMLPPAAPATPRLLYVFDSHPGRLATAREQWKRLKGMGYTMAYWQQTEGPGGKLGWQQKA